MTQYPEYLKYLEQAKRAELTSSLEAEGFTVTKDQSVGNLQFDLLARKGDQQRVYEFKSVGSHRINRDALIRLQKSAKEAGYEFHVVVVNPPPRVDIEIDSFRGDLLDHLINEQFPQELNELSSHTRIDDVPEVDIASLRVSDQGILVEGTGTIEVSLEYGGGEESDGSTMSDAYPFQCSARLHGDGSLASVDEFAVDTTSFYK